MTSFGIVLSEKRFYELAGVPSVTIIVQLAEEQGVKVDAEKAAALKEQLFLDQLHRPGTLRTLPRVEQIIRENYGRLKMAVGSGGRRDVILKQLSLVGLENHFETIVTAEDTARHKPHPDVFLEAARRLGVPPADCCVYEDAALGFEAARRAGMQWVDVTRF